MEKLCSKKEADDQTIDISFFFNNKMCRPIYLQNNSFGHYDVQDGFWSDELLFWRVDIKPAHNNSEKNFCPIGPVQ